MAHYELYAKQLAENPVDQATVAALIVLDRKKRFYKHVNVIDDATGVTAVVGIVLAAAICQITYVRALQVALNTPPTSVDEDEAWGVLAKKHNALPVDRDSHLHSQPTLAPTTARSLQLPATMTLPRIQATSPRVGTSQNHFEIAGL